MTTKNKINLGIIAGEGKFPVLIARQAKESGLGVFVVGIKGSARAEDYAGIADKFEFLRAGALGAGLKYFKENNVAQAVMAGRVEHTNIFNVLPDMRGAKVLFGLRDMRAASVLQAVIDEFEKEGIKFMPSHLFLEKFIPSAGLLSKRALSEAEAAGVELGKRVAKTLADLDVGLTCVVAERAVLAVEGMEGTDNCILRAGDLHKKSAASLIVVKVARSNQDDRYDLPVIGKGTIDVMKRAGARVLAIEAGKTLVLDLPEVVRLADGADISLIAF